MMISKEQARAAARQLADSDRISAPVSRPHVSAAILQRAVAIAKQASFADEDRVAEGRLLLATDTLDSQDIAAMMIHRIVSDALR
jgi:hypothetical protein